MRIHIDKIPPEGLKIRCKFEPEDIDTQDIDGSIQKSVHFQGEIQRLNNDFIINGIIEGSWSVQCARCLDLFDLNASSNFRIHLKHRVLSEDNSEFEGFENEHLDESTFSGDIINLSDIIREQMILQLPIKPLCSEDCKGLCPICGINLNHGDCDCDKEKIDPRLSKLKDLFKDK